ncbi:M23 family metallopeptidase [Microbacterium rhizophilus]|uniref:M23 family metallopeptidase n=1 Tax=Microbacterium rhizophilus TaxID=3138934 RepID=UPI0031E6FD92
MRAVTPLASAVAALAAILLVPAPALAAGGEVGGFGDDYFLNDTWTGTANRAYDYGLPGDGALVGDWNGDGADTLAARRGRAYLFADKHGAEAPSSVALYGRDGDVTLVGDWNGDGRDTLAVRRGRTYYINDKLAGGEASSIVVYGREGDDVLIGDWDGDGKDTIGVRRGNVFHLRNSLTGGEADVRVPYGRADDRVYVGDWDGDGIDTIGVRRDATYFIKNDFRGGEADRRLVYGRAGDATLVGDWNGDGSDTLGVRRGTRPAASTASWADGTYGAFAATTTKGSKNATVTVPSRARRGAITIASADRNLTLDAVRADGSTQRLLSGLASARTVLWGDPAKGDVRSIRVTSRGSWVLTSHPVSSLEELEAAADGAEAYLYSGAGGAVRSTGGGARIDQLASTVPAKGAQAILYPDRSSAALAAGAASGKLLAGPSVATVSASGAWKLALPALPQAPAGMAQPTSVKKSTVLFPLRPPYRMSRTVTATHEGADLLAAAWSPVYAVADGVVHFAGPSGGAYGNLVTVNHVVDGKKVETRSAHLINTPPVVKGQRVSAGQIIGYVGQTGNATIDHLHIEVRVAGKIVDPMKWLPAS